MTVYIILGRLPRFRQLKSQLLRMSSRSVSSMPSRSILMGTVWTWRGCIHSNADGYVNSSTMTKSPGSRSMLKILYRASVLPHERRMS